MGRSVVPDNSRASPRAPSRRKRLCSAIPSSMCWPVGDSFHWTASGRSANAGGFAVGKYTPFRLIHPARCVVTATSADTVTTDAATGRRASAPSARPNASWVELSAGDVSPGSTGTSGMGWAGGDAKRGGSRRTHSASSLPGANPSHSAHGAVGQAQQALVLGVRHGLEPALEVPALGRAEQGAELPAPAKLDDPPAAGSEHGAELAGARVRDDAVERLAVHVHDPEDAPQPAHRLLSQPLPDIALVELGIAHHDDDAPRRVHAEMVGDVA